MKSFALVRNLTTNATRLYEVPGNVVILKGTLVNVQYRDGEEALGIAASDSFALSDDQLSAVRLCMGFKPDAQMKHVLRTYAVDRDLTADAGQTAEEADEE